MQSDAKDWNSFVAMLGSTTGRLAMTYLAIIMLMSVGFSLVFYNTSSSQLARQLPPPSFYDRGRGTISGSQFESRQSEFETFFKRRIDEGRRDLVLRLFWLNMLALALGGVLSYYLARRTLEPIEEAMEAQSRFVSDASHELRTPITVLQTTNEVALRKKQLSSSEAREIISQNVEEAIRLKNLTDNLLELLKSGGKTYVIQPVSMQEVASESMNQIVGSALAKNIAVKDEVKNIVAMADSSALSQVVTILLDNAIKYSPNDSTITMRTNSKGDYTLLEISDKGIGITATDMAHIFERFYRADNSRTSLTTPGYGLGLSIAKQIIEDMNGTISVKSKLSTGSTFTIKLPTDKSI